MSTFQTEFGPSDQRPQHESLLTMRPRNPVQSSSPSTAETAKMAIRRRSTVSQRHWNLHKAKIERLFLFEGKTLPEIMEIMVQDDNFHASKKMYKTQMKSWQLGKYLRKEELSWMHWKANQRRREVAKDTEFLYRGQRYTSAMVQQRLDRRRIQRPLTPPSELDTPCGLDYATPATLPPSPILTPLQHSSASTGAAKETEENHPWKHYRLTHGNPDESTPESKVEDLLRIRDQAELCEKYGENELAEQKYREALSGLESLLSNIHDDTITTAYLLATFYARTGRMKDADLVLDRVTASHLDNFSAIHPQTARHLFHVMKFFGEWSRADERDVFALRIFESLSDHARAACTRLREAQGHDEAKTANEIDKQLDRLKVRAESELHDAQATLHGLIEVCDADIQYNRDRERPIDEKSMAVARELSKVLTSSEAFLKRLWRSEIQITGFLIGSSIQLAHLFVRLQHYDQADCTFTVIAHKAHVFFMNAQDSKSLINVLLYIGILYQSEGRWDDAQPHFEHAWRVCYRTGGEHEGLLKLLEEALRERIFRPSKLPSTFKYGIVPW